MADRATLFKSGGSQEIRLPNEYRWAIAVTNGLHISCVARGRSSGSCRHLM